MAGLKPWELIIIVLIVLLLFGSKKLPDAARGIGRSLRIFKAETKGLMDDEKAPDAQAPAPSPALEQQTATAQPIAPPVQYSPPLAAPAAQQVPVAQSPLPQAAPQVAPQQAPMQQPVEQPASSAGQAPAAGESGSTTSTTTA